MGNTYFRFKQFTVNQDKCAMKVSTDACILGAWVGIAADTQKILDIGTGTGLLTMMMAQRSEKAIIHGIELDRAAAQQAFENVQSSPWKDRIEIINADATKYEFTQQYELIVSNPPFFNNSLLGSNAQRNNARHTLTLTYQHVFDIIRKNLSDDGTAVILLPVEGLSDWQKILVAQGWHIATMLEIHPRVGVEANRVICVCKQCANDAYTTEHLFIRECGNEYSHAFQQLMQPYYLDK